MDEIPMGAFYMKACRLSQGFGSHAMGEKHYFLKNNIHVVNEKLYFVKGPKTRL
jgi:hypothetical protein